mgnify:CR=1 FL=1
MENKRLLKKNKIKLTQIYYLLARIAGVAAHREVVQMTSQPIAELVTNR